MNLKFQTRCALLRLSVAPLSAFLLSFFPVVNGSARDRGHRHNLQSGFTCFYFPGVTHFSDLIYCNVHSSGTNDTFNIQIREESSRYLRQLFGYYRIRGFDHHESAERTLKTIIYNCELPYRVKTYIAIVEVKVGANETECANC